MSGALDTEQMIEYMRQRAGAFMRILDGSVEAIDQQRGWARLRWHPTEACCHSGTIVQGGFVTSMLDAAMAHAITAKVGVGMMAPTLELKVSFFRICSPRGVFQRRPRGAQHALGRLCRGRPDRRGRHTDRTRLGHLQGSSG